MSDQTSEPAAFSPLHSSMNPTKKAAPQDAGATTSEVAGRLWSASQAAPSTPPLPRDWTSTWLVLFVAAAMGFLASLGVAAASAAETLAQSWTDSLTSRATVIVETRAQDPLAPPDALSDPDVAAANALAALRRLDGVVSAQPLDDAAMSALVDAWLGEDAGLDGLALPRLIDLQLSPDAPPTPEAIEAALATAGVPARLDTHGEWVDRLRPAAEGVRSIAYGALGVIGVAAALTVALACSAGLAAQSKVVDVLKLVGAEDAYISRIFVRRLQLLTFAGSAAGATLAVIALVSFGGPDAPPDAAAELAPFLPSLQPQGADWVRFTAIPLAFALIATLAARIAVGVALQRRER